MARQGRDGGGGECRRGRKPYLADLSGPVNIVPPPTYEYLALRFVVAPGLLSSSSRGPDRVSVGTFEIPNTPLGAPACQKTTVAPGGLLGSFLVGSGAQDP